MPTVVPPALNPLSPTDRATSFATELAALLRSMPGLFAPAVERADWYDRKADLLDRVAAEDPGCDRIQIEESAQTARERAESLRRGCS
ncbi:hypothetical protein O7627_02960 [Solwaraspora sp. WMMD1047]|uniref:hypothetical protein n=1 Tax=Solwaraspora sp. WMMD1047 TaxID=3016102 RepID=UPI00241693F6|nr:hypothetical protein [Solwaraspora sp. WMMD1047]MDG4828264.1 hypothetical protein [Solwaraspora sp. WMMD1047]